MILSYRNLKVGSSQCLRITIGNKTWTMALNHLHVDATASDQFVAALELKFFKHIFIVMFLNYELKVFVFDADEDIERMYEWL